MPVQMCVKRRGVNVYISIKSVYWIMCALPLLVVPKCTNSYDPTPVQLPRDGSMVNFQDFGCLSTGAALFHYLFD